jgi:hypothetical protein
VITEWNVVPSAAANSGAGQQLNSSSGASGSCKATVYLDFQFHKSTWLQGTIESNTKAELIGVYELWLQSAQRTIRRQLDSAINLRVHVPDGKDLESGQGPTGGGGLSPAEGDGLLDMQVVRIDSTTSGASTPSEGSKLHCVVTVLCACRHSLRVPPCFVQETSCGLGRARTTDRKKTSWSFTTARISKGRRDSPAAAGAGRVSAT